MTQTPEPARQVIAGLGWRALAAVIDALPIAVVQGLLSLLLMLEPSGTVVVVLSILAGLLSLGWAVLVWWGYATRGQGPGAKVAKIQVLDVATGTPIGWGRYFLRELVWVASSLTAVVWIILVVLMVMHPHRRGWHDLAAKSVVVKQRVRHVATPEAQPRASVTSANVVALPAHLRRDYAPEPVPDPSGTGPITAVPGSDQQGWSGSKAPWEQQWGSQAPAPIEHAPGFGPQGQPAGQPGQPGYGAQPSQPGQPGYGAQPSQSGFPGQPGFTGPQGFTGQPGAVPGQPGGPQPGFAGSPGAPAQSGFPGQPGSPGPQAFPGPQPFGQPGAPGLAPQPGFGAGSQASPPVAGGLDDEDDGQHTHLAMSVPGLQRSVTEGWQVRLDDGRVVDITGLVLVGRNPQPRPDEQAELVSVGQDSRMVSKTHLAVGLDHRGIYVMDRNSTNGTAIANANGDYEPCAPGDPVRVREGQVVSFGDHYLEVRRRVPEPR